MIDVRKKVFIISNNDTILRSDGEFKKELKNAVILIRYP